MTTTAIEWAEQVWNPLVGCTVHSPGCTNCYAMRMAHRLEAMATKPDGSGNAALNHYRGTTRKVRGKPVWTGKIGFSEAALLAPLRRRKPTRYFVNSMSDLFHESVPDETIDRIFAVMAICPQHTFQVLTKRSDRMRKYVSANRWQEVLDWQYEFQASGFSSERPVGEGWPLPNVWLGVSVEDQAHKARIDHLRKTPAAIRWISAEPLLESLGDVDLTNIDWVVTGGESGPNARPMHPDWPRSLRDQCQAAGVPFFFKQWGEWAPGEIAGDYLDPEKPAKGRELFDGRWIECWSEVEGHCDDEPDVYRIGKKRAGRLLDGREWSEFPA